MTDRIYSKDFSNDIYYHLEQLECDLLRMQMDNNRNFILSRSIDVLVSKIKMIKNLIQNEPRFNWNLIQSEMDRLFSLDKSLTGYNILFDFSDTKNPNRALIPVQLFDKPKTNQDGIS